jgi:DNA-binding response OmpR family regulator
VRADSARTRILLIEDESRIAGFIKKGFSRDGSEVVVAEDGEVGTFFARTEPFDIVILDLGLPGRSGLEVLERIRVEDPELPIIVLTGHDEPDARRSCMDAGASGFVTKPFAFEQLQTAISEHL